MNAVKRKRSRVACKPCRERKRKCDGGNPCITCTEWGYDCSYETQPRRKLDKRRPSPIEPSPEAAPTQETAPPDARGLTRRLEANSGAAFVRRIGLRVDPTKAPRMNLFGWNIGARPLSSGARGSSLPITEITFLDHMKLLATTYFQKVDPCYGFIDRHAFFERLEQRWQSPLSSDHLYDSVLAGVAALGCLFSQRSITITELHLVESARSILDTHVLSGAPPLALVTGWVLRVAYLRMTASPHSTWTASSTLMHLVEAAGFHLSSSNPVLPFITHCDPEIAKRIFGVAQHLNMWTSFDLGLSRVVLQKQEPLSLPSPRPGECMNELLSLLPISASLDPGKPIDNLDIESKLSTVLDRTHTQPPSVMAQCNLVLCMLRRLHTQNFDISHALAERVLALLKKALGCAHSMVADCSPWQHIANVPFQIICVLLVMDTRPSLAMLSEAVQTLELVASTYDTETMREACKAAHLLIMLHQQRRRDDLAIFSGILNTYSRHESGQAETLPSLSSPSAEEYSWLGALVADLPGLQKVDFDQFLNTDIMSHSF